MSVPGSIRVRCLVIFLALLNLGAAAESSQPLPQSSLPDVGSSLLRLVGALGFVIALFLAGVWLFRNWQRLAVYKGRVPKLNILEVKSLGGRHALYLVGYEQQRFLLSSSPAGVNLLAHLPESDSIPQEQPAPAPAFLQSLQQALTPKR